MPKLFPRSGFAGRCHCTLGLLDGKIGDGGFSWAVDAKGDVGPSVAYSGSTGNEGGSCMREVKVDFL